MLQLDHLPRRLLHKRLHDILVGQEIGAEDGIPGVRIEAVVVTHDRCRATLSRHRVATHRIDFRHHPNGEVGGYFCGSDSGT